MGYLKPAAARALICAARLEDLADLPTVEDEPGEVNATTVREADGKRLRIIFNARLFTDDSERDFWMDVMADSNDRNSIAQPQTMVQIGQI